MPVLVGAASAAMHCVGGHFALIPMCAAGTVAAAILNLLNSTPT